jgi:hypothetical protein
MNEPEGKTLKDLYNSLKNKKLAWLYMRYFTFFHDFTYDKCHEIISPRDGLEYFTYRSDKFWTKIIYGLIHLKEHPYTNEIKLCEAIHYGSRMNLINFWFPILQQKNI